jgi:hypothetical protein
MAATVARLQAPTAVLGALAIAAPWDVVAEAAAEEAEAERVAPLAGLAGRVALAGTGPTAL